jgi:hypothetical protein
MTVALPGLAVMLPTLNANYKSEANPNSSIPADLILRYGVRISVGNPPLQMPRGEWLREKCVTPCRAIFTFT